MTRPESLGDLLVNQGLLSAEQLNFALLAALQSRSHGRSADPFWGDLSPSLNRGVQ